MSDSTGAVLVRLDEGQEPPHVPTSRTRKLVAQLASFGLDEKEIGVACGVSLHVLRKWYKEEIEHGLAITISKVGVALVRQALRGDVNAARFFLQSRARWVVPTKVEMTGKDGGPVELELRRKTMDNVLQLLRAATARQEEAATLAPSVAGQGTGDAGSTPPVTH